MGILWIIIIGFVAGLIARWLSPGPNTPGGFILTTVLGIAGAFFATWLGQAIGWYRPDQGAGFIGDRGRDPCSFHLEQARRVTRDFRSGSGATRLDRVCLRSSISSSASTIG